MVGAETEEDRRSISNLMSGTLRRPFLDDVRDPR